MNQKTRLMEFIERLGRVSCETCERTLHIRSVTTRVSEINKRHKQAHGYVLIKATEQWELNPLGKPHPVTYYEINHEAQQRDLFTSP
jgi:hypothetical protein